MKPFSTTKATKNTKGDTKEKGCASREALNLTFVPGFVTFVRLVVQSFFAFGEEPRMDLAGRSRNPKRRLHLNW